MPSSEDFRMQAGELLSLCSEIRNELTAALDALDSARRWGIWDILGGGMISSFVKHSRIDGATAHIRAAKPMLARLGQELGRYQLDRGMDVQIGGFAVFADFVFDGLFADLYMQDKINKLADNVERMLSELQSVEWALRQASP